MRIELHYFVGCPQITKTRSLLKYCLAELGLEVPILELVGNYPSPTIIIDGEDIMGEPVLRGRSVRLDVPTHAELIASLRDAIGRPWN
ncbi:MAG: alkylmercury lyase [Kofleriaceae bacterium]